MKLTKTQIEAIANKIRNELSIKEKKEKDEIIDSIKKTSEYKKLEKLLDKREEYKEYIRKLNKEINNLTNLPYEHSKEATLASYLSPKLPVSKSIYTIIDDITIATIDKEFNVDTFIDNYINK